MLLIFTRPIQLIKPHFSRLSSINKGHSTLLSWCTGAHYQAKVELSVNSRVKRMPNGSQAANISQTRTKQPSEYTQHALLCSGSTRGH